MSQAYPQFTPVQILEAGQRAFGEGRTDYAAQFFQHLIEHYADTAEAATARDTMAQINGAAPQSPQVNPLAQASPATQQLHRNGAAPPTGSRTPPGYAQSPAANGTLQGVQLSVHGANGHHNGHAQNGHMNGHERNGPAALASAPDGHLRPMAPRPNETSPGRAQLPPMAMDAPRNVARHNEAALYEQEPTGRPTSASQRAFMPAPEKNYIIGRVIAGLLLIIGIVGILAGIVLVYAAVTDPGIYATVGIETAAQALVFSGSVFVASVVALIGSQMATALFDGADAAMDLARLERHKAGESDDA